MEIGEERTENSLIIHLPIAYYMMNKLLLTIATVSFLFGQVETKNDFKIEKRYLNIPVSTKEQANKMTFNVNGKMYTWGNIKLATDSVEYWMYLDMKPCIGKNMSIDFDGDATMLNRLYQSNSFVGQHSLYKEALRPQFHFSAKRGWINDPNGLYVPEDGLRLKCTIKLSHPTNAGIKLNGQKILDYDMNFNKINGTFYSPQDCTDMNLSMDLYIDRTSVEGFFDGGLYSFIIDRKNESDEKGLQFWGNEDITTKDLKVYTAKSIWK